MQLEDGGFDKSHVSYAVVILLISEWRYCVSFACVVNDLVVTFFVDLELDKPLRRS